MPRSWQYSQHDESRVRNLSAELKVSPLLAQILIGRGVETLEQATFFLEAKMSELHDPTLLPGVNEAVQIILDAIQSKRPMLIYGDYDVDGVTSTSILWHCLKLVDATVEFYIPDRREEGYGLNSDAIRRLHEEKPDRLLITVDCGISSVQEVALAKELGLDVIITDHHTYGEELPPADALVHPSLPGSEYPCADLCGAGVAFKLAWALCQQLGDGKKATPRMKEFLLSAMGLAAIGTVADVVPLRDENRILVRFGLASLSQRSSLGLKTMFRMLELDQKEFLRADDIGFKIAPRINAAGRLKQAVLAVELLTTEDEKRASLLATYLNELNRKRQTLERSIVRQAKEQVKENPEWEEMSALVLADDSWHPGVIGIVANRIAEHFEKPTFLIALDKTLRNGQGSGRSFGGLDLHSALVHCSDHLMKYGGHRYAAGLRIETDAVDGFRSALHQYFVEHDPPPETAPVLPIDAEVRFADITLPAVLELDRLGPFGAANESPLLAASQVKFAAPPKRMGQTQSHLTVQFMQHNVKLRAIAFGKGDWADEMLEVDEPISICFRPMINEFRGRRNVELELVDWKRSSDPV